VGGRYTDELRYTDTARERPLERPYRSVVALSGEQAPCQEQPYQPSPFISGPQYYPSRLVYIARYAPYIGISSAFYEYLVMLL
jgi:hypothetical protein